MPSASEAMLVLAYWLGLTSVCSSLEYVEVEAVREVEVEAAKER